MPATLRSRAYEIRNKALIVAWRAAALADGWTMGPRYAAHEPIEQAFELRRDGFHVVGLLRGDVSQYPPRPIAPEGGYYSLVGWCPKGIALELPLTYDMAAVIAGERICAVCHAEDVDTFKVAFADRACAKCRPDLKAKLETANWAE